MKKTFTRNGKNLNIALTAPSVTRADGRDRNVWGILASAGTATFSGTYTGMALSVKGADQVKIKDVLLALLMDAETYISSGGDVDTFIQDFGLEVETVKGLRQAEATFALLKTTAEFFTVGVGLSEGDVSDWREELDQ